jgi:hypothetical protein
MYTKSNRMYAEFPQILSQIVDIYIDRLGANMHVYESIDKIPEICRACGDMWSKMEHYGEFMEVAQLHIYLYVDK